jgi:hypothetical protein
MIGVCSAKISRICWETDLYTSKRGFTKIKTGHCRLAVTDGIADLTPN